MYKTYLFDLDGTITDPGVGITDSVIYALSQYGITVEERSQLYRFIGPPLVDSFRDFYGFNEEKAEEAVAYYREYYREKGIFGCYVYDGIEMLLQTLREKECHILLATSKPEPFARRILEHFNLHQYFDVIAGSDFDENELARLENASEAAGHGQTNGNEAAELSIELEENQNGSTETNENSSSLDAAGSGNSDLNGENENTDAADGNTDSNGGGSSDTESAQTRGITLTDDQKTVWAIDGSWANYIYRATDGNWYDGSGRLYYENGGGSWTLASSGESATEDAPTTPSEEAISSVNVTDDFGYNSQTLYETGSGEWMNNASGVYTDNGDGTFTGPDGTLWYEN